MDKVGDMMNLYNSKEYLKEIEKLSKENIPFEKLKNKSILITGGTGLIGSFLVDTIMYLNNTSDLNCTIYVVGLGENKRFPNYERNTLFKYLSHDVNNKLDIEGDVNFVLHLASNTHPVLYAKEPVSTITTNVIGTKNMLDFAISKKVDRFLFTSSVEIYGTNKGDVELFDENYCGYINSNTLRAGYPEGKRCGEALCQAYKEQNGLNVVIARLSRIYGPTVMNNDSKAIFQFIFKALNNEDIILKSDGTQFFSYTYVADAVYALLIILLNGENGEAYNISYPETDITLKELATTIASSVGRKVVFELPNEIEKKGFSNATTARMDNAKIKQIGFNPKYDMGNGINSTIHILKEASNE